MTEWDYNAYKEGPPDLVRPERSRQATKVVQIIAGISSLWLTVGMGYWAINLARRDVSGVAVVKALAGPMRLAPDNPGGDVISYQGLSVNEIAAKKGATDLPDKVILAPSSIDLSSEDAPGLTPARSAPLVPLPQTQTKSQPPPLAVPPVASKDASYMDMPPEGFSPKIIQTSIEEALSIAIANSSLYAPSMSLEGAIQGGQERSIRPKPRPLALMVPQSDIRQNDAVAGISGREISYDDIAIGTRLVQLGSFSTPEVARLEWVRLSAKFDQFFADKVRVVQRASVDNKIYFRLRAHGFIDTEDSKRFCAALQAEEAACIPAVKR
jgi:hypothetical protein